MTSSGKQSFATLKSVVAEFDNVKAVWKAKTTEAESRMETLNSTLQAGFEMRDEQCVIVFDVKAGKIVRIRPLHFDWKYDRKDFNAWRMEAHGQVLEPSFKSLMPPYALAYKKRVYSPNRILYPMKRVDFEPSGAPGSTGPGGRNTETRGTSKYVRVSWAEALDMLI